MAAVELLAADIPRRRLTLAEVSHIAQGLLAARICGAPWWPTRTSAGVFSRARHSRIEAGPVSTVG
jgi:hypothetical protein